MVRLATPKDLPHVVQIFARHHAREGFRWAFDGTRLASTVASAIHNRKDWLCITGDECAMLAACIDSPLGAGRLAVELMVVAQGGRQQFGDVLSLYHEWATAQGCRATSLGCTGRFEVFERLYRRHGYRPAEMIFSREI